MRTNVMLVLAAFVISFAPLFMLGKYPHPPFDGADSRAEKMISNNNPQYQQWFEPIWHPPSREIETLLFALQAATGSGVLFYYLGYIRGKATASQKSGQDHHAPTA
jgi:cobalt/nickel transport protein